MRLNSCKCFRRFNFFLGLTWKLAHLVRTAQISTLNFSDQKRLKGSVTQGYRSIAQLVIIFARGQIKSLRTLPETMTLNIVVWFSMLRKSFV